MTLITIIIYIVQHVDRVRAAFDAHDGLKRMEMKGKGGKRGHDTSVTLAIKGGAGTVVDRFLIKEELAGGQRILAFTISVGGGVGVVYNGTAVGSAHIAILDRNITAAEATLKIEATRGGPATVNLFAVPNPADCALPPAGGGCSLVPDTLYQVNPLNSPFVPSLPCPHFDVAPRIRQPYSHLLTTRHALRADCQGTAFKTVATGNVQACCNACRAAPTCAVFTAVLGPQWPYTISCSLMGAMTGSTHVTGVFSGSPER